MINWLSLSETPCNVKARENEDAKVLPAARERRILGAAISGDVLHRGGSVRSGTLLPRGQTLPHRFQAARLS